MPKGRGMPSFNPGAMQKQLQELQQKMVQAQEALASETVTSTVGGGAVAIIMTGQQKAVEVKINAEMLKEEGAPLDVEMLQDLMLAAINDAIEKSQQLAANRMGAVTGGLGIPGLT